jgi:putative oxidoreductase
MKEKLADFGLLWLRVLTGLGLIVHGWLKLSAGVATFADKFVDPIGFPYPMIFAWLGVATEVLGGFFFILGLWTRWAAVPVVFMMAVAAFSPISPHVFIDPAKPSKELTLAYLMAAVAILCLGAGRFAVDASRGGGRSPAKKSKH